MTGQLLFIGNHPLTLVGILALISLVSAMFFLRRQGYFVSYHSLRLRANVSLIRKQRERLFVHYFGQTEIGSVIRDRYRYLIRIFEYTIFFGLIAVGGWFLTSWASLLPILTIVSSFDTAWQVHATITGFSFVALVFFWETLKVDVTVPEVVGSLTNNVGALGRIYILIGSNIIIGIFALITPRPDSRIPLTTQTVSFEQWFGSITVLGMLLVSIIALIRYYESLYNVLFEEGPDEATLNALEREIEELGDREPSPPYGEILRNSLGFEYDPYLISFGLLTHQGERITAEDLALRGSKVTDVHLAHLGDAFDGVHIDSENISLNCTPGTEFTETSTVVRIDESLENEERQQLLMALKKAIRV